MTQLANARIAVTGGRGFLGRAVCRAAAQAGLDCISIGRSPFFAGHYRPAFCRALCPSGHFQPRLLGLRTWTAARP